MQDIYGREQVDHHMPDLIQGEGLLPPIEFIRKHLLAEFKDTVNNLLAIVFFLKNIEQLDELLIRNELAQQGDLTHRAVVDPIGNVLKS